MGARGPKPVPTEILGLRGSWRAKQRDGEPALEVGEVSAPEFLSEEARAEWDRVAPVLQKAGCLTAGDVAALSLYCQSWADWREAVKHIEEEGYLSTTPNGYSIASAWVNLRDKAAKGLLAAAAELGLSPSARTRIRVASPKDEKAGIMVRKRQA